MRNRVYNNDYYYYEELFWEETRRSADHATRYSFKSSRCDERGRRDVDKQSKRIWCALKRFRTNQGEIKHENEQNKRTLWVKRKESVENNVMNDDDKIFWFNKICDASRMRRRDENNEWIFRKTNNETEEDDQKIEKSGREDERHDERKYLNKDSGQAVSDRDLSVLFARNQRSFEAKIKQKNEIDDLN